MTLRPRVTASAAIALTICISTVRAQDITGQELLDGLANPSRWLTYSGDYAGQRFSPLTGANIFSPPTSYAIDGRQYVVMPSGATLTAFALPAAPPAGSR